MGGQIKDRVQSRQNTVEYKHKVFSQIDHIMKLNQSMREAQQSGSLQENDLESYKSEIKLLIDELIEEFGPRSTLDIKTQIFLVNKLSKEDALKRANQTILQPLWRHLG